MKANPNIDNIHKKVKITPRIKYLKQESSIKEKRFVWKYHILIENKSKDTIQLLNRHWKIYNDSSLIDEVFGPGVVGLQPLILPKQKFEYESFCILDTQTGKMEGAFDMQTVKCEQFKTQIPDIDLITDDYQPGAGDKGEDEDGDGDKGGEGDKGGDGGKDPIIYN
jgi:ApaG protein